MLIVCVDVRTAVSVPAASAPVSSTAVRAGQGSDSLSVQPLLACRMSICWTWDLFCAGTCWVLADNEALQPPQVIDSRAFGPLPADCIRGRVLYYGRPTDHGPVQNSPEAAVEDAALLATELDVDKLISADE